ncbi:MAG TPA: trypsin-like peptidase domain-containing protein [Ignavibacteria bacterium]|nr:trypsin-like peptidase domain-containing protein [Ignavibacteria bacterium]HRF66538.1 trypsin-like peptidase domain-containing protein [Ignavibacteria bacterium]HRJ03734.1 trypsin-like peptidase domain-containing protein [Ignavibacteria bacterium]
MLLKYLKISTLLFILVCVRTQGQQGLPEELTPDKIFEKVNNSVVVVLAYDNLGNMFQGSGVVINSDGLIVTNHHVCKDANRIEIKHYNKEIKNVSIYKYDEVKDILFLQTDDRTLTPIPYGSSSTLRTGQRIYAVGSPEGYENSISEGIVSGFRTDENNVKLIQMTCPITDGSSGGAVLNSKGELIGLSVSGQHEGALYFAIPVNDIYAIIGIETQYTEVSDPFKYYEIGTQANESKNYNDAEVYFSKYLEKFSSDATAYYKRGYARFKLKEYKKAISDFSTVLQTSETSESFFYRGNCYYSLKDYKNALADYNKAIEQEPDNYDIYYNRGYANFRLKNYSEAVSDWQKAVELNPDYKNELDVKIKIAQDEANNKKTK